MAINLKEIFNTDDDNIRVDKINYNFDQLLANGGGPTGIQGVSGQTGLSGPQGDVGATGPIGATGLSGSNGISQNIWSQESQTDVENTDFYVVRPFNIEVDSNLDLKTRIILGDENSSISNGGIPTYTPQALLSIITPQDAVNNTETQSHIELKDYTANSPSFLIRNNYTSGIGGTFQIIGNSASSGETSNIQLVSPNLIKLESDNLDISIINNIVIASSNSSVEISAETDTTISAGADVFIVSTGGGNIEIGDGAGDTAEVVALGDYFKTNSTTSSELSSPTNKLNASLINEITSLGENTFTSALNTSVISNTSTPGGGIILEASTNYGSIFNKVDGNTKLKITNSNIYSYSNIEFGLDSVINNIAIGYGVEFTEGSDIASPSYNTPITSRTFNDYFYESNLQLWKDGYVSGAGSPVKCIDFTTSATPGALWYDINSTDAVGYTLKNLAPYTDFNTNQLWGNFSYVKTGHKVEAWGNFRIGGNNQEWSGNSQDQRHAVAIILNNNENFPYTNDTGGPIHVDIEFAKSWNYFNSSGNSAGEFYNPIHNGVETGGGIRDIVKIKGVINEGDNKILLLWEAMNPNFLGSPTNNQANDIITSGMAPSYFISGSADVVSFVSFRFSMFTNVKSYADVSSGNGGGNGGGSGSGSGAGSGAGSSSNSQASQGNSSVTPTPTPSPSPSTGSGGGSGSGSGSGQT